MTIKISRSNYEEFMIDHLDGTLSTEREAELLLFLEANPDLKEELESLDNMVLTHENPIFEFRDGLKKSILDSGSVNTGNFEDYCIAFYENDLLNDEENHLHNFVHDHPSLKKDYELYGLLKLSSNSFVEFPYKTSLQQFASTTVESISETNYIDFLIAKNEGDLSLKRLDELNQFLIKNPKYQIEAKQMASLKLHADMSITFANKSMLKRRAVLIPLNNKWMNVAAASVAMLVVFYSIIPQVTEDSRTISRTKLERKSTPINQSSLHITPSVSITSSPTEETRKTHIPKLKKDNPKANNNIQTHPVVKIASVSTLRCTELEVKTKLKLDQENYAVNMIHNSKSIEIVSNNSNSEKTVLLKGYAGKAVSRLSKLIGKSDRLDKKHLKSQLRNFADLAVVGFNKMTEGNLELPGNSSDSQSQDSTE